MAMTTITIRDGQKPTREQIKRIRAAAKLPVNYTPDCPPSTPKALVEFAAMARELRKNKRHIRPAVTIRLMPDCLEKYKAMGKGYTGVMADVLEYAVNNPEILTGAMTK
ncbi:MAG: BrnA antitoxin family protein [Spirochaetaceae bacterium]|jgi:uncharacterized protein (DUF4415 family)|nr:BrnA antitoxin family protein [Spirochaetaceae bacterium]